MPRIEDFFPEWTDSRPMIYAYTDESFTSEGTTELSLKLQPW